MNFIKWVKSIQTAGYYGARTVYEHGAEPVAVSLSHGDCWGNDDCNITQWSEILEKHSYFHGVSARLWRIRSIVYLVWAKV